MPGPLKVLHVICDLSSGGAERLVLELCRRRSADIEVAVATVQGLGPLEEAFRDAGVPVRAALRARRSLGVRPLFRLARWMEGYHVVHTHLFAGDTWGRLAALTRRPRPVIVTTEHNINRDETWQRAVKRALAPASQAIVCVSEAVAAYTQNVEGITPVRVIPNGIDS